MNNKKGVYVWIIIVLVILGIIGSLLTLVSGLINIKSLLTSSLLSNPVTNLITLGLSLVELILLIIYFPKLYNLKIDAIKWTNIIFTFYIAQSFWGLVLTRGFAILLFIPWIILTIIVSVVWKTFVKNLKKIQNVSNVSIPENLISNQELIIAKKAEIMDEVKNKTAIILWLKSNKKLAIIISIIVFVTIFIPVAMFFGVEIMSKAKCGDSGYLNGDFKNGYNCSYVIVKPEYTDISQCMDSKQFCESKGKTNKEGLCLSGGMDLTNKIKYDESRGYYIEQGPIECSYCCGTVGNDETQTNNFKYDPNGPYPSPIVDSVNMINARGEKVDKFVKGTFKVIGSDEIFENIERYNSNQSDERDYNDNAITDCITKNCSIIYFKNESNNMQGRVALFSDKDTTIEGVVKDIKFYIGEKEVPKLTDPIDRTSLAMYGVLYNKSSVFYFRENLCSSFKGGDFSCHSPSFDKGDKVFSFFIGSSKSLYLADSLVRAKLISYQYYMSPDTGEVFPVVEVNK